MAFTIFTLLPSALAPFREVLSYCYKHIYFVNKYFEKISGMVFHKFRVSTQIHHLISEAEEGREFGRIPDHQEGVRCKAPRSDEGGVFNHTPQRGANEGNDADDALMVNQGQHFTL